MKQTILSKCFSKMKRVALTLFAALCVGSVWAGYLTFEAQNFAVSEDGTITFNANLGYHGTDTDRYAQLTAVGYNANGEVAFQETKVIGEELTELKLEEDGEGDGCVTYPCTIANSGLSATESYKIEFHFWAVKADGSLSADYDITRYVFPPIGVTGITAKYGDLKFRIFGNIESGYNVSAIKVNYILGTGTPNLVADATIDAEAGTFLCEIPYTPTEYKLTYKITVEYADGTSKVYLDDVNGVDTLVKTRRTVDNIKVIYTWTGEGDGTSWTDELNWTVNSDEDTVGYPGTHDGSYYRTMFAITKDVECIDLKGGTYGFVDDGAMYIAPNTTVKFKNGKFRFTSSEISRATADASGASDELIGSNGGTLIFEKVYLRSCKGDSTESGNLAIVPRSGATIVFEGTYSDNWDYYPKSANTGTKIIIRNGELTVTRQFNSYASGSQNDVLISNAMWKVNNASSKTITPYKTLTFRDGPDRQAQIVNTGDLKLVGTYDFALPATPYSTPYYKLRKLSANAAGTIKVDVTNYKGGGLVPLIAFSGTIDDNTKNSMKTITTTASKLKVNANGVDVKAARNAKLVWDETAKILYFQQDSQNAASIGTTEYATLGAALDAAADGATIKVLNNVEITSYLQITKSLTLDLNGKSITRTDSTDNSTALFVNAAGATVTITGDGTVTADHAVYVNAGKVVIENGTFSAGSHAVYVINNGNAEIKGGTFSSEAGQYHYALNEYDQTRDATSIVVTGGTFVGFNPANNTAEGENTNFCAPDYEAVAGDVDGTWVVQKAISELKPGVPVTNISATTEEEAINKVELKVEVPENANITKDEYAEYFKIVATETSEGSGVWEVAAVLDDTKVKPVIAETTPAITFNENGTVTVNIENKLPGLNYGVRYATTVEAVETTAPVAGFTVTPADGDTAGFFKVVVDFAPIADPEAE